MKKIERKEFLTLSGGAVVGGMAGFVFSGAPFMGFQWLAEWSQDQYVPPSGKLTLANSINSDCTCNCQVSVKKVGPRAIKIESAEGVCPSCLNALQLAYHPDRIHKPLKQTGAKGSGKWAAVSWEEAKKDITSKLKDKKNIAGINKQSGYSAELLERFITTTGSRQTYYEPSLDTLTEAALGGSVKYDLENADYILSFGAKLVEGWGNGVDIYKNIPNWVNDGNKKIVQIDTVCTRTASMATEWVPLAKPGTEGILAMGIANYLIRNKQKGSDGADFSKWSELVLNYYSLEKAAALTGVNKDKIIELAESLLAAKNPVVVAGRGAKGVSSSSAEILAVYALNSLIGSKAASLVGSKLKNGTSLTSPSFAGLNDSKKAAGLDEFIEKGSFDCLLINEADPVYKSVNGKKLVEKMKAKGAFVVAIAPLINDTAEYADYILPSLSFLEVSETSERSAIKNYAASKHSGDYIIEIAKEIEASTASFPWDNYNAFVLSQKAGPIEYDVRTFSFKVKELQKEIVGLKDINASKKPLSLVPIEVPVIGDGDGLAFPYVLKTIDSNIFAFGKQFVHMNKKTAHEQGVGEGSSIKIISERGTIGKVKVHLTNTVAPGVIAIPLGFGHAAYTKYAKCKGVNPKEIMTNKIDPLSGTADWWLTKVEIS
ncbi:MAG: molybdopterin-dependent oxidoreductase [bacterium]|nr:molybdopterin-dependent oxidoreductase [bacterium]